MTREAAGLEVVDSTWRVDFYQPRAVEFDTQMKFRSALRGNTATALRLTKMLHTSVSGAGAMLPVSTFRLALDEVSPLQQRCAVCGRLVGKGGRSGVTSAGIAFHARCVPGSLAAHVVEELLPFAEELEERRTLSSVVRLAFPQRGR